MSREIARLKLLFLIINDKLNLSSSKYVLPSSTKRSCRLNHTKTCQTYKSRIDAFKQSFFVRTIEAWNLLPSEIVNIETVSSFEHSIAQLLNQQEHKQAILRVYTAMCLFYFLYQVEFLFPFKELCLLAFFPCRLGDFCVFFIVIEILPVMALKRGLTVFSNK